MYVLQVSRVESDQVMVDTHTKRTNETLWREKRETGREGTGCRRRTLGGIATPNVTLKKMEEEENWSFAALTSTERQPRRRSHAHT